MQNGAIEVPIELSAYDEKKSKTGKTFNAGNVDSVIFLFKFLDEEEIDLKNYDEFQVILKKSDHKIAEQLAEFSNGLVKFTVPKEGFTEPGMVVGQLKAKNTKEDIALTSLYFSYEVLDDLGHFYVSQNYFGTLEQIMDYFDTQITAYTEEAREIVDALAEELDKAQSGNFVTRGELEGKLLQTPNIYYKTANFDEFMTGFMKPLSKQAYDPVYCAGPKHGERAASFLGAVCDPNGKAILVPFSSLNIGIYDPIANEYISGPAHGEGTSCFLSGELAPNGEIILTPYNSKHIGIYNPSTNEYTSGPEHGEVSSGAFAGAVCSLDGKIILIPYASKHIGIYDPVTRVYTSGPEHGEDGSSNFFGGVVLPNGKIILIPNSSKHIGIYDPATNSYTSGPAHGESTGAFSGGILIPGKKIIMVPFNSKHIGIYDPDTNVYKSGCDYTSGILSGGALTPDNKIIMTPRYSANLIIYDPQTDTYELGPSHNETASNTFVGSVFLPCGKVVLAPYHSERVGVFDLMGLDVGRGYCVHPFLNHF